MPHTATDLPRAIILHPNDGCLTVARVLVRRGVEVVMLATQDTEYLLASRGTRGRVMPDPRADPAEWAAELGRLAEDGGGVLICGSDNASEWLAGHRADLPASLRSFESTDGVHELLMDKRRLYHLAAEIGVRAPWMHHIRTVADLDALGADLTYPCVLKGALGHVARAALGHGTIRVESRADLMDRAGLLFDLGIDFLLTEMVPGDETALEGAVTVRDRDGGYPVEYGRHKLRQWPPDYGVGSLTSSKRVPGTLAINRAILDHVGYYGVSSCETKRHEVTGELYLIEINVRVPGSYGLAEASGVDGAWRLYATAAGMPLPPQPAQVDGRHVMLPDLEFRAASGRVRSGDQTWPQVLRSWLGTRDFGIASLRDPGPALAMLTPMVRRKSTRLVREAWQRLRRHGGPSPEAPMPVSDVTPAPRRTA